MCASGDEVTLIEVIGAHAHHEQAVDERAHGFRIVIYAFEENRLVAQRNTGKGEFFAGFPQFQGALIGVVDVDAHPDRAVTTENIAEFRSDSLGQEDGNARANADKFDMGDFPQFAEQVIEFIVGEQQGVAPAEEYVADLRGVANVFESGFQFRVEVVVLRVGDESAAGAVAAVGGASIGY